MTGHETRIAILASGDRQSGGGGSTADKFTRDILEQDLDMSIGAVICNNPPEAVPGLYARFDAINTDFRLRGDSRIDVVTIGPANYPGGPQKRGQTLEESSAICRLLEKRDVHFAVMLGFMRILTGEFVQTWGWQAEHAEDERLGYRQGLYHPDARISNNHPAILPFTADTHGLGAHQRAMELHKAGLLGHTAMTWHLASAEVDKGPIIDEVPVPIEPGDDAISIGGKVQAKEKELTAVVIAKHLALRAEHLRAMDSQPLR